MKYRSIFRYRDPLGRGVDKNEDKRPTFKNFFKFYFRKFSYILSLNLLMIFQVLPILIAVMSYFMTKKTPSVTSAVFAPAYGISLLDPSAATTNLLGVEGIQLNIPIYQPNAYWIIAVCAVFYILTIGWQMCGCSYVLRNLVRGDAVFVYSDFFHAIKKNRKQGFLFGLIDAFITAALAIDLIYYYSNSSGFGNDLMLGVSAAIAVLYLVARPYMYMMLVTFDMKIRKIFKNALIFTALGIKRNLLAILGVSLFVGIHAFFFIQLLPTLILLFVYVLSTVGFIIAYAVYPIIDRYMIAPYRKDTPETESVETENE